MHGERNIVWRNEYRSPSDDAANLDVRAFSSEVDSTSPEETRQLNKLERDAGKFTQSCDCFPAKPGSTLLDAL
jgi:hypothetical protein